MSLMIALGAAKLAMGIAQGVREKNKQKRERDRLKKAKKRMRDFEANRQPVINQANAIRNIKNQLSNPYANLPVAMQAAEMQMEQTDQALANTLDTVRASGAGGATALAQAAAQSKAKVSAGIEQQEAANAKMAAEGEAGLMAQKQNLELKALSEEVSAYGRQEARDAIQLDRMQGNIDEKRGNIQNYGQASTDAFMSGIGGFGEAMMQTDFTEE